MKNQRFILFFLSAAFIFKLTDASAACTPSSAVMGTCTGSTLIPQTCSYPEPYTCCNYWTSQCAPSTEHDPAYPQIITILQSPIFTYTMTDPITSTCSGSNGSTTCNGGTTTFLFNQLPAPSGACTLSNPNSIPTSIDCSYNISRCVSPCTSWTTCYNTIYYDCSYWSPYSYPCEVSPAVTCP